MEDILDIYQSSYDPKHPIVCFDERPKQLIGETRQTIDAVPGRLKRYDYEYKRNGVANLFMMFEPLGNKRYVQVTEHRTKKELAWCWQELVDQRYPEADKIILVVDNLNIHKKSALYEVFEPTEAKRIASKLEIHYTPKHGSWLNMAEIEISILSRQCLAERMENITKLKSEVTSWATKRNTLDSKINWQFTTADARIKLKKLYPSIEN